jgi:exopolyphosphatase/guanosine-5'-triphosphate,3'-diphosphate pyrophosphatase
VRKAPNRRLLADAIAVACGENVDILDPQEEARLAFAGALASRHGDPAVIAVVDVGGGSTELVAGTPADGPVWLTSVAVGSSSLTRACVRRDPPSPGCIAALHEAAAAALATLRPPPVELALAVGGSATTLVSMGGGVLDEDVLERALAMIAAQPAAEAAREFDMDPERTRLLPAGIVLLLHVHRLLGVPLQVASGGVREGVVLAL